MKRRKVMNKRRKQLFAGLVVGLSALTIFSALPQTGDRLQGDSGCREDVQGCLFDQIWYNVMLLVLCGFGWMGVLMLNWGFKYEDRKKERLGHA